METASLFLLVTQELKDMVHLRKLQILEERTATTTLGLPIIVYRLCGAGLYFIFWFPSSFIYGLIGPMDQKLDGALFPL